MSDVKEKAAALETEATSIKDAKATANAKKAKKTAKVAKKQAAKAKKTAKIAKAKAKKGEPKNVRGAGLPRIGELLKKAKGAASVIALCKPGASVTNLKKIRDEVNAQAETARESKKTAMAKDLAMANRIVRRLIRGAK